MNSGVPNKEMSSEIDAASRTPSPSGRLSGGGGGRCRSEVAAFGRQPVAEPAQPAVPARLEQDDVARAQSRREQLVGRVGVGHPLRTGERVGERPGTSPTATTWSKASDAAYDPTAACSASPSGPSSSMEPSTAQRSPATCIAATASSAARMDSGFAL